MKSCATPEEAKAAAPSGGGAPPQAAFPPLRHPLSTLAALACLVVVVGGMRAAAPLLTQFLLVAFIAIVVSPCYYALRRVRFPSWAAITALLLLFVGLGAWLFVYLLPPSLLEFSKNLPHYHSQLVEAARDAETWLLDNDVRIPRGYLEELVSVDSSVLARFGKTSLTLAGNFLANCVVVLVVAAFLLAELPRLPKIARSVGWLGGGRWELLARFANDVRHYMGIKAAMSAATGLVIWAGLRLLGVASPVLLGFVAFVLNFVPAIGSVIAAVPGVLLALGSGGTGVAAATAGIYLAANQIIGNVIEPRVMGAGFGVSPVVVLLSAVFWSWVLGPVGMLLAVPLTMAVRGTLLSMRGEGR